MQIAKVRPSRLHLLVLALTVVTVSGLLSACGDDTQEETVARVTPTTASSTPTPTPTDAATGASGSGGVGGSGGSQGGTSSTKPQITSFKVPATYDCSKGTFPVSWTTKNATKTTLSIDGSGVYSTHGQSGSDSLPANCDDTQTVTLTAFATDGSTMKKTAVAKDAASGGGETSGGGESGGATPSAGASPADG